MMNENHSSLLQIKAKNLLDYGRILSREELVKKIDAVTSHDIMDVAHEVLNNRTLSTLVYRSKRNR
jgi:predicted Zn-dependent peptidase